MKATHIPINQCHQHHAHHYSLTHTQLDGPSEKVNVISEIIARELMGICTCTLSAKYIADTDLICVENSMDQVVFQGRLISTDDMNSTDIILHLEHWAQTEPTVTAKGVQLTVSNLCSVQVPTIALKTNLQSSHYPLPGITVIVVLISVAEQLLYINFKNRACRNKGL